MEKWEYLTIQLQPKKIPTGGIFKGVTSSWDAGYFSEQLNLYGRQGWDLVSCFTTDGAIKNIADWQPTGTDGVFAAFKRKTNS